MESQELLELAIENGESEMIENLRSHVDLITMFIFRIDQENPTQEELQHYFIKALSSGGPKN